MHQQREQRYYETAKGLTPRLADTRSALGNADGKEPEPTGARRVEANPPGVESDRPNVGRGVLDGPDWPKQPAREHPMDPSNLHLLDDGTPV